jgi:hypothetical protein
MIMTTLTPTMTMTMRMMTPTMMIKFTAKTMIQNTASYSQSSMLQTLIVYNTHFNIILQYVLVIFQLNVLCTNHPNHFICHFTWRIIITVTTIFFAGFYKVLTHNMKWNIIIHCATGMSSVTFQSIQLTTAKWITAIATR